MKLELKHLAPYLPYKLKIKTHMGTREMGGQDNNDRYVTLTAVIIYPHKPILRPLSDYEDGNGKSMNDLNCDLTDQIDIQEIAAQTQSLHMTSYGAVEIMLKNHIDFLNLIPEGLAIDFNKIK